MAGGRVGDLERAERINAAAVLAESGVATADAVRVLAERFAVSTRQARRYVDQAASSGRVEVPEASVVFTVKLPARWPLGCVCTLVRPGSRSPPWWPGRCRSSSNGAVDSVDASERPAGRDRVRVRPPRGHGLVGGLRHSCAPAAGPQRAVRPGSEPLP